MDYAIWNTVLVTVARRVAWKISVLRVGDCMETLSRSVSEDKGEALREGVNMGW